MGHFSHKGLSDLPEKIGLSQQAMALKFIPDAINFYYPLFKRYFTTYPDQHEVDFQVILHLILELHRNNAWRNKKNGLWFTP